METVLLNGGNSESALKKAQSDTDAALKNYND
jgi:hypothetical protein